MRPRQSTQRCSPPAIGRMEHSPASGGPLRPSSSASALSSASSSCPMKAAASSCEISTWAPWPVRLASSTAAIAVTKPNVAALGSEATNVGEPRKLPSRGSVTLASKPDIADKTRPYARIWPSLELAPKPASESRTIAGLARAKSSKLKPNLSRVPAVKFSRTRSDFAASSSSASRCGGSLRSSVTPILLRFRPWNDCDISRRTCSGYFPTRRSTPRVRYISKRLYHSTLMTSAPRSASNCPSSGPDQTQHSSITRTPLRGKALI